MIDKIVLKRLLDKYPSLTEGKKGFTCRLDSGQWVHSRYDPVQEAKRLMKESLSQDPESTLLIFLGCGLGYHIELAEEAGFKHAILVEKNPELYDIFSQIYRMPETYRLFGPNTKDLALDFYLSTMEIYRFKKIKTIVLRGAYEKSLYQAFEERLERLFKVKLGDFTTRIKFEEIWFIHILKNMRFLSDSIHVLSLFDRFSSPFVVISAGPSLRYSLDQIRRWKKDALLVAVDTALLVLYEAGIQPDFVYSLDSQIYNLNDFSMIPQDYLKDVILVYDLVVHPALAEKYPGPKIVANTAHLDFNENGHPFVVKNELVSWLELSTGRIGDVETGGSVATSAFHFAYLLGGNPIVLCGQDLAYTRYQSHSVSTPHYYRIREMTHRLKPIESVFLDIMKKRRLTLEEGIRGSVWSDFMLANFKGWFEESAGNLRDYLKGGIRLINASQSGVKLKGFENDSDFSFFKTSPNRQELRRIFSDSLFPKDLKLLLHSLRKLRDFTENLESNDSFFALISESEFTFLLRYFMKEKIVFDRYGKLDFNVLDRKLMRLQKTLNGVIHEIKSTH